MSVMQCDRRGCRNVLCQRVILNHEFYICEDCWKELLQLKRSAFAPGMTRAELHAKLLAFMRTETRGRDWHRPIESEDAFNEAWNDLCPEPNAED